MEAAAQNGLEHGDLAQRHVRQLFVSPHKGCPDGKRVGVLIDWSEANEISTENKQQAVKKSLEALFSSDDA